MLNKITDGHFWGLTSIAGGGDTVFIETNQSDFGESVQVQVATCGFGVQDDNGGIEKLKLLLQIDQIIRAANTGRCQKTKTRHFSAKISCIPNFMNIL